MLSYQEGDLDAAIADLTAALGVDRDPALLANRALAYRDAGRLAEAAADYTEVVQLDPDDEEASRTSWPG